MKIDIYPSVSRTDKYLAVPSGTDFSTWRAPAGLDPDFAKIRPLQSTIDLLPEQPRIALDPDDVIAQINQRGWALIKVGTTIEVITKA